jgi:hypothetical protein
MTMGAVPTGGADVVAGGERRSPAEGPRAALRVEDLSLAYVVRGIRRPVLRGVTFEIRRGESSENPAAASRRRPTPRSAICPGTRSSPAAESSSTATT